MYHTPFRETLIKPKTLIKMSNYSLLVEKNYGVRHQKKKNNYILTSVNLHWAIPEKNKQRGGDGRRVGDKATEFPGILKKLQAEF